MTCNPDWPEIQDNLFPGQSANDRRDLTARVFRMKSQALIHDIMVEGVFGRAAGYVYCIEYQKRGLPHMHIVVWLHAPLRIEDYDSIACCELPDPQSCPELFELVMKHMVHTCRAECDPSHRGTPEAPFCKSWFPQPYSNATVLDERGWIRYRRRDPMQGGRRAHHGPSNTWVDNSRIVAYNAFLLRKYKCHINVVIATSLHAIKYLFKYIHKGGDHAAYYLRQWRSNMQAQHQQVPNMPDPGRDEVQRYVNARWIGSCEVPKPKRTTTPRITICGVPFVAVQLCMCASWQTDHVA